MAGERGPGQKKVPPKLPPNPAAMPLLPPETPAVSPLLTAGLLLAALRHLEGLGLPRPTAAAVVGALGVSRSRAYELRDVVEHALPTLGRPVGRPTPPPSPSVDTAPILRACRDFAYDHPGAVGGTGVRRRYSDTFRRFILDLLAKYQEVSVDAFAEAAGVPAATLRDWLRGGLTATAASTDALATPKTLDPTGPQMETLLTLWSTWKGSFLAFCRHANEDWRLPFGRTLIAHLLAAHGVRFAHRRSGRSPDEDALRGQFLTWFPDAQWVGDGALVTASVDGESFPFNLELLVDPFSGAFTGVAVTDTEDAAAVVAAVRDAQATTDAVPESVLLDNKPSNHAELVKNSLAPSVVERATPFRPQNKAHIEGGFGLFRQIAPALAILAGDPRAMARTLVELVVVTWARTINHRPRNDRGGRTRVNLHLNHEPTPEEVEAARAALRERLRRYDRSRATLAARQNPQVRAALTEAFTTFAFDDPDGAILDATARYSLDAVVEGIAVATAKHKAGSWPDDADARYLLGIVRRIAGEREQWELALALWQERGRAQDRAMEATERTKAAIDNNADGAEDRLVSYVDRALGSPRQLDRFFWLGAIADTVCVEDKRSHEALFLLAARRIASTHAVPHKERASALRFLAARLRPLA